MTRFWTFIAMALILAGCGGESHQDLRRWMKEQGENVKPKIEALPQVKPYEPFAYNAFDLPDPFKPRRLEPSKGGGKMQPDLNRHKEPLEAYSLETLKMVGTLQRGKTLQALVRANDKNVLPIHVGSYMGQNYGVVTAISENEIRLKELVQDSAGDWSERTSSLLLEEAEQKQEQKK
jgi:type IV pilus assembly protein PilP